MRVNASVDECGGDLEGASGILQSPSYPSGYPHKHICRLVNNMHHQALDNYHNLDLFLVVVQLIHRLMWVDISCTTTQKWPNLDKFPLPVRHCG